MACVGIAVCDTSDKSHGKGQVLVEGLCVCVCVCGAGGWVSTPLTWSPPGAVSLFIWSKTYRKAAAGSWGCIMFFHVVFSLAG